MTATGGLEHLAAAMVVFLASHRLVNRPAARAALERRLGGAAGFTLAYSLLSLVLLAWIIAAYRAAPMTVLWTQEIWMRWVPNVVMPFACQLIAIGMATPNPFSIGPGGRNFDPAHPGLLRLTRHPVLWGLALWAAAHILPNGDVGALMVFLPLLALALIGPRLMDAGRRRRLGRAEWSRLAALTGHPRRELLAEVGWGRFLAGAALYAVLLGGHEMVIGVSPIP